MATKPRRRTASILPRIDVEGVTTQLNRIAQEKSETLLKPAALKELEARPTIYVDEGSLKVRVCVPLTLDKIPNHIRDRVRHRFQAASAES